MSIAILPTPTGDLFRPNPVFRVVVNDTPVPGYAQSLDDPLDFNFDTPSVPGMHGTPVTAQGAANKTVSLSMRVLTSLVHATGMEHLNNCLTQYREALAILARTPGPFRLYLGDTDRYLEAWLTGYSLPLEAPDHKALTYSATFLTKPFYRGTTLTQMRTGMDTTRSIITVNGSPAYTADGYFPGTQALTLNNVNRYINIPNKGSMSYASGSVTFWAKPTIGSGDGTTRAPWRTSSSTVFPNLIVNNGTWHLREFGTSYSTVATTFVSGDDLMIALTWSSAESKVYVCRRSTGVIYEGSVLVPGNVFTGFDTAATTNSILGSDPTASNLPANYSNYLSFDRALTETEIQYLFDLSAPYDIDDDNVAAKVLNDVRLNGNNVVDVQSNAVYADIGNSRETYPVITIESPATTTVSVSFSGAGKSFIYSGPAKPRVIIDCGGLTAKDSDGLSMLKYISNPDFGLKFQDGGRAVVTATVTAGDVSVTMDISPRYER